MIHRAIVLYFTFGILLVLVLLINLAMVLTPGSLKDITGKIKKIDPPYPNLYVNFCSNVIVPFIPKLCPTLLNMESQYYNLTGRAPGGT